MKKLRAYPVSLSPCFASWGHGRYFKDPLWQNNHNISFINILIVRICGPAMVWWWCFVLGFFALFLVWLVVGFCVLFPACPPNEKCCCFFLLESCEKSPKLAGQKKLRELSKDVAAFPSNLLQSLPFLCSFFFLCQ